MEHVPLTTHLTRRGGEGCASGGGVSFRAAAAGEQAARPAHDAPDEEGRVAAGQGLGHRGEGMSRSGQT